MRVGLLPIYDRTRETNVVPRSQTHTAAQTDTQQSPPNTRYQEGLFAAHEESGYEENVRLHSGQTSLEQKLDTVHFHQRPAAHTAY